MVVYLDNAAGALMPEVVRHAYLAALSEVGNPSSIHSAGRSRRALVEQSRETIARSLAVDPVEVTFTGGGTEAVNLGVKGLYWHRQGARPRPRILVPRAEHHATLDAVHWLVDHESAQLCWLEVDSLGRLDLDSVRAELSHEPESIALLTLLHANNEVGTLQPVREVAELAAAVGVPVHVDAIAAYGQIPLAPVPAGVSAVSLSAHKLGGPVGVGALIVRRATEVVPLLHGGSQQRARSGTLDAAGAAAFAAAVTEAMTTLESRSARVAQLRDYLADRIIAEIPGAFPRGAAGEAARARASGDLERSRALSAEALPATLHLTVSGAEGDSLLMMLDLAGFAVSTGSACQAGVPEPSHVLLAMGVDPDTARGALRFSLGATTTADDIEQLLAVLPGVIERALSAGLAHRTPTLGR